MLDPAILLGEPLVFMGKLKIYPPTVKEVATNQNYGVFYKTLTISYDEVQDELKNRLKEGQVCPQPFEYLMACAQHVNGFSTIIESSFLLFCHAQVRFNFNEAAMVLTTSDGEFSLTGEFFFEFQNMVRRSCGDKILEKPEQPNPDEDPRITEIKRRARERDKLKARRASKDGISLETCLVAICCMGIGLTPLNIGEMSYASIGELIRVMQNKEKYDIDIRSLLAGADSKKVKPKYWIRNE